MICLLSVVGDARGSCRARSVPFVPRWPSFCVPRADCILRPPEPEFSDLSDIEISETQIASLKSMGVVDPLFGSPKEESKRSVRSRRSCHDPSRKDERLPNARADHPMSTWNDRSVAGRVLPRVLSYARGGATPDLRRVECSCASLRTCSGRRMVCEFSAPPRRRIRLVRADRHSRLLCAASTGGHRPRWTTDELQA
jgi:hypothetical protein